MMPRQMPSAIFASQPALDAHRRPPPRQAGVGGAAEQDPPPTNRRLKVTWARLNTTPAHLPGDRRPLAYQLAQP
jgi:hypothetical protein